MSRDVTDAPALELRHEGADRREGADERFPTVEGDRRDRMERAVDGMPLILFGVDAELRYSWLANVHAPWTEEMLLGRTDAEVLGEVAGRPIMEAKDRVLRTGRTERLEVDMTFDRQRHWYEVTLRAAPDGLACCALDISEKKRREIMLQALLREVSHRSKNLLSMVLSIAQQTSRKALDKQVFLKRFTGRIQSIARSQDTITGSDWRGATLSDLLASQVLALIPERTGVVRHVGPDLQFTPNAALHFGLALHELTTNAVTFGALSHPHGTIAVRVVPPAEGHEGEAVTLEWDESDGQDVGHPEHESFGMVTLKRIVPAAVSGQATIEFLPNGLRYRLTVDPSQFDYIPAGAAHD